MTVKNVPFIRLQQLIVGQMSDLYLFSDAISLSWNQPNSKASPSKSDFRMTHKLGEGTFSEVLKVKHKKSGKIYAMKRFKKRFNSTYDEIQNLREIQALRRLSPHKHVVSLVEVLLYF